jgi:alkylhydroperoxidase family enzyme
LAYVPDVANAYAGLINKTLNQGSLPVALKELAVIKVSLVNGCEY